MFRIVICDDEKIFADAITKQIHQIMISENMEYEVHHCREVVELEDYLRKEYTDLLFLDIMMPGTTGMEYAKRLRDKGNQILIIFVTSNTEYALEAYSIYPLTFLRKPIQKDALQQAIIRAIAMKKESPSVVFKDKKKGMVSVPYESIMYVESRYHEVAVCCERGEEFLCRDSFSNFCSQLPQKDFVQCHRCYTVNLQHAKRVKNYMLILDNQQEIPISRTLYKQIKERFAQV